MKSIPEYAVIAAAGIGTRMNTGIPKQFLKLGSLPVLMHSLRVFYEYSHAIGIILVLQESEIERWNILCRKYNFKVPHRITAGGSSRFQSVKNGLSLIGPKGLVAIHDGVRPLVEKEIIAASFKIAAIHGSAIAAVRLKESIRETDKDKTKAVDRSRFRVIQTPQTFKVPLIRKAYEREEDEEFTDDASVAEKAGLTISLFEGSYSNIKITTAEDLILAKALLKKSLSS